MASHDTVSDGNETLSKHIEVLKDRPIISKQSIQSALPARPAVAAKPRRKPPAPSPKPSKPPPPPHQPHSPVKSPLSSPSSTISSSVSNVEQNVEKLGADNAEISRAQDDIKSRTKTEVNIEGQDTCQNNNQNELPSNPFEENTNNLPVGNPFEEESEILPSKNPFEEDTEISPSNPFEEDTEISAPSNPFEEETEILNSTHPFEEDAEIATKQAQVEAMESPRRLSQPPPLPTSPPSKARLSRSLSGIKVNSSAQNKTDSVSAEVNEESSDTSIVAAVSLSSTSSLSLSSAPSSSLTVISPKSSQLPPGKSPPPLHPKPVPSNKKPKAFGSSTSTSNNDDNPFPSPNPPPRISKATKIQTISAISSTSESNVSPSENQSSENNNSISSSNAEPNLDTSSKINRKVIATPPPPVPKKSPKHVPKPTSVSNIKPNLPPPRPLSPPTKSQSSPLPKDATKMTSTATTTIMTKESSNINLSIPEKPTSSEKENDLGQQFDTICETPALNTPSQPLNNNLTQAPIAHNPDPPESTDRSVNNCGGKDGNQIVSSFTSEAENKRSDKEPDKKKVPPPLPKNPPRGRPLRRSVSGSATQADTPPPPPPPRAPQLSSCLRSVSLQNESLTTENRPGNTEALVNHTESKEEIVLDSHPVAPVRQNKTSVNNEVVKHEVKCDESLKRHFEENDSKCPVENSSIKSVSEVIGSNRDESRNDPSEVSANKLVVSRAAPRPVPRKRLSINSAEISKEHQEEDKVIVSDTDCQLQKDSAFVKFENEYSEVYRGDSPEKISENSSSLASQASNASNIDACSELSESKTSDQNLDESSICAIDSNISNSNAEFSLSKDEPEATCGMLKEIEELLKNKLGVSEESNLLSLSEDDIDVRISRKDSSNDLEFKDKTEEEEEEPIRPPRPKRDASLNRELSGSLTEIDSPKSERRLSSTSDFGLTDEKKSAPPKPKRTTLPRVGRSLSDVSGSKSVFERLDDKSSKSPHDIWKSADDSKPELPPRNESLKKTSLYQSRQQTTTTTTTTSSEVTTPPPLPPRNKPRSMSMNAGDSKSDNPPPKPFLSSSAALKDGNAGNDQNKASSPKRADMSAFTKGALPMSATGQGVTNKSPAPRPVRKAPPPPPNAKRHATFGPGDQKSPINPSSPRKQGNDDKSVQQASRETSPLKTTPNTSKSSSSSSTSKVKKTKTSRKSEDSQVTKSSGHDAEYHEISDAKNRSESSLSPKTNVDDVARVKKSPPPKLPPRPKIALSSASNSPANSHKGNDEENSPASIRKDTDATEAGDSESSGLSTEEGQDAKGKRAQFSRIRKGSQEIASDFRNSSEISSPADKDENAKESIGDDEQVIKREKRLDLNNDDDETGNESEANLNDSETNIAVAHEVGSNKKNLTIDLLNRDRRVSSVSNYSTASEQDDEDGDAAIEDESSHSDTDPEDAEAIYAERKAKKVFNIAQEIASSERTFVEVLKLLNLDFRLHVSKETEKQGQPIIPAETLNKILDFLPQLQNFNEDLLKDLEHRVEHWENNPCLSDIFVKKGPFLKLYSSYIRNFENSTAILDDSCKKNHVFAAIVKDFEMGPKCGKLALKHFMLKPIQRIPQYKLLLQEYLKNLHPHSQDYKNTTIALNIVTEVADHANESMRHGDNVQKLLEIQRSLIGQFEVIQPGREFIKQGELQKVSRKVMQPRMFFLFSDVLLYTTPVTSGFKLNNILPLSGMKVNNSKLEVYKNEFNIISIQRSFTLCASSSQEKKEWLAALHNALDENVKRFNTFESQKGPQTLIDKDFVLGAKAPLWVPDPRVTMCMLCLSEFTITWRKHHCRSCGRIICQQCSNNKAPLRYLQYKPARVCNQCYDKLHSDMLKESQQNSDSKLWRKSSFRGEDRSNPTSPTSLTNNKHGEGDKDTTDSSLGFNRLLTRFQRIRKSGDKRNFRPSVLKEVHANDEGSDMSGYLWIFKNRKWKKLWFVVKGKVLYTYKASEDMAARESMPLLGYEVTRMNTWYEGAEPDLLFELSHQNTQPLVSKTSGDPVTSRVMPNLEKTKQRLIFRTDSAAAVTKWLDVLRAASCT